MTPATPWRELRHYLTHPLGRRDRIGTLVRIIRWQIASRVLDGASTVRFVDGTRLSVRRGMHGATGNIYVGLMEFGEMGFAMHLLREGDVFVDVGANVGVYSIMAAARGAKVLAIEPVSTTYQQLMDNVYLNRFGTRVTTFNVGVGGDNGELGFSSQCGPMNHVIRPGETEEVGERVTVRPLDEIVNDEPVLIKIDVEGFESEVIRGGEEVLRRGSLRAVIIELNGLGARYAYSDDDIHSRLLSFGFQAARYEPFSRRLTPREGHNTSGNTLYVRSAHEVERRLREARPIRWGKFQI